MFEEKTRFIIQEKYVELVGIVIDELQALPIQNIQDNINTPFENVWEAFVNQLQSEDNTFVYAHVIEDVCQQVVQTLTLTEAKLLWLISEGSNEWEGEEEFPEVEQLIDEVAEELFSWVEQEAEEPEFEENDYDEDEDSEVEYYDEDASQTRH